MIEQELEGHVNVLENSPSMVTKEDQAEHDIVISCDFSSSKKTKVSLCCKKKRIKN